MMKKIVILSIGMLMFVGFGCTQVTTSQPEDFSFTYHFEEGSLPPPYHYEYTIEVDKSGLGKITFIPDYSYGPSSEQVPRWVESFNVTEEQMSHTFQSMYQFWGETWKDDDRIGAAYSWLDISAHGETFTIPSHASYNDEGVEELYVYINELVPAEIWSDLETKREVYMDENQE